EGPAVGGPGRAHVGGAIAGDVAEAAGRDVDEADVAEAAGGPRAVGDELAVGREGRGEGLLEARARHEIADARDLAVVPEARDLEVPRALGVPREDEGAAVGAHGRLRGAEPVRDLAARRLVAVGRDLAARQEDEVVAV